MRKWLDKAAPDDPGAWYDLYNMWPTKRGTYETADASTGTSIAATSAAPITYAFVGKTLTTSREYVVDTGKIWEYSGGTLTDRTGGVTVGSPGDPMMAMFGNITICAMGVGQATVYSSGGNFAALAGAPNAEIVVTQSNCVLLFNTATSADGWAVSDTGDYTNWSTGTAESGRIIQTPGPITAACAMGNDVYVFKENAIYRMTYTLSGWAVRLLWYGIGCSNGVSASLGYPKYQCVATASGIAFSGGNAANEVYLFDGVSRPVLLNPDTTINSAYGVFCYHPIDDALIIASAYGSALNGNVGVLGSTYAHYYYSFPSAMWGIGGGSADEDWEATTTEPVVAVNGVLQGDYYARAETSVKPVYWRYRNITTNAMYRCVPSSPGSGAVSYVYSKAIGTPHAKTTFKRVTPMLRRRTDLGTDTTTLDAYFYNERHKIPATPTVTKSSIAESGTRARFDLLQTDNYMACKVTFNAMDVEVDDLAITSIPAGTD